MSGGVNVKSLPRAQPGSSIPLHRTRHPSPKPESKSTSSGLPRPSTHVPVSNKTSCSSSPTAVSSRDVLRDTTLRNQHLLLRGSPPSQRSSTRPQTQTQDSRSAHSSPQVRRKESPLLRGALDGSKSLLDLRSNGNKNFQSGIFHSQMGRMDNDNSLISEELKYHEECAASGSSHSKTGIPLFRFINKNLRPGPAATNVDTGLLRVRRERVSLQNSASSSFSDEEMCTPDDLSPEVPQKPPPETTAVPKQETSSVERLKAKQSPKVNMAAVAPFRYRLQIQEDISLDDFSDCSSDSIEVCCDDLNTGGMLGGSPRGQGVDLETEADKTSKAKTPQGQAGANGVGGMAAKRGKSGLPQATPRAELKVYRAGNSEGHLPVPSNLRKQKSLTNLCVLTDAEKKMHPYQPKWSDDMEKPGAGQNKSGKLKDAGGGTGKGIPLSKNLSKSEHSLFQGKPKPFSPPSKLGKASRIPKGPYAEVKPISKAQELADDGKSDDEILSSKAKANGKKTVSGTSGAATPGGGRGDKGAPEPEEGDKTFLKVDPELVVTVLGDLEQLLFSQMLDPESQRKRTVQNVLDLRQNLEDTMSSLRGSQLSHSCIESSMCYDSDETNARSISSLSNRSSPLSWRQSRSSPRLQAGDAPSSGVSTHSLPIRATTQTSHLQHIQLIEGLDAADDDLADLKSGYLSDSNLTGKSQPEEEDDDDVDVDDDDLANGWDESSSISSGLSDGSDNLSSEEFNAGSSLNSLPTTPIGSRRNSTIVLRTDAEKRSLVESGLSWYSEEGKAQCRNEGGYNTGSLKAESSSKWKKSRSQDDTGVKGELRKPQTLGHPPSGLKKSRNPPVGVTSPITHTSQSMLKVPGVPKNDQQVVDKAKMAVKTSGLQRSSSDAGKDRGEHRKPPSGLVRPSASTVNSFGYKKSIPTTGTATVLTNSGSTVSGDSAIVNKTPKTSGIPVKPSAGGVGGGRKTSLDVSNCDQGFMAPNPRNNIQYRSLPRPAKSSTLSLTGGRPGARPFSSNMDAGLQGLKTVPAPSRLKEPGSVKSSHRASTGGCTPVNQTDREKEKAKAKAVASDSECGGGGLLKNGTLTPTQSALEPPSKLLGLRQPSSVGKYSELPSPNSQRPSSARSLPKPAHLDKVNSNSLDFGIISVEDQLPPKVLPFSKLQDLSGISSTSCLTPSPAPILNVNSSECFSSATVGRGGSAGGSPSLYPRLSGLHRSMESLSLQMSVSPAGGSMMEPRPRHEDRGTDGGWSKGSRASLTLTTDSSQRDRNTLPKKGLSQHISSQAEEDSKERRHSQTIVSLTETNSPPQFPSPILTGKTPLTSIIAPSPTSGTPRMTRSNSIPTHEASFELYQGSPLGSTLSLAERPKSMIRSGSFRDREACDDVHGSVLSLASNASSSYSSAEERIQGEQIRKLRRELESSQEKVANLTSQLSANANLVAAFEQSLTLMTSRLQNLSFGAEQKDSELLDLRETIDNLKTKNMEAQAVIHVALNNPDVAPKELRIRRQNSSESISSLNSITSHSSVGSLKDDAKKKKKKNWLRSSFGKAFSIKKGAKDGSMYSDIEEIATPDSSAPNSPKLGHEEGENPPISLPSSQSATPSVIHESNEENESDEKMVSELRSELWEKEMKLTDIRLEALSSAHQLEHLREAMNNMHRMVDSLKAENDQLKTGSAPSSLVLPCGPPSTSTSQPSGLASFLNSNQTKPPMSLTKSFSLSLNECSNIDVAPMELLSLPSQRDEALTRVVVRIADKQVSREQVRQQDFYIGSVRIHGKTEWSVLDTDISTAFGNYISQVDPSASMGLSVDSIHSYSINQSRRVLGAEAPESSPCDCLKKGPGLVTVTLKGFKEKCVDSLVFETIIPKPMMQHYISLLLKHRRLVLSGPSGAGKTYLTTRLAEYLLERSGRDPSPGLITTFNMHQQTCKDLQLYLSNLANQIDRDCGAEDIPLVIIVDDISDASSITDLVNSALTCKYHKCPYVIGTTNQSVKMPSNHGLHLSFRMVTFSNNVEPANGFLVRYLHRKLIEAEDESTVHSAEVLRVLDWVPKLWYHLHTFLEKHSTSDFLIGPCFFLSCPVTLAEFRSWFIDLWNQSIIPYLQEGAKDGVKVHGQKAAWEDPVEWVRDTLPWPSAQQDQAKLFHLPPPTTGPNTAPTQQPSDDRITSNKDTSLPTMESDPLMAILLKLQESANYIESPERDISGNPTF
ncbi:neuron navigator 1 [Sinocyclocheilus anshuiensis]|uniref:neuron navigator 1 n=1 Tax=Sinocyclocheilus anshuiensis TaxID=1608454 RepID=UPI0007B97A35|nr:PREDICTED: neuron navigator 1-like [Sinocyclocheilus anshuiensis]